ncbi:hypothetical protein BKA70DRAFT_399555 [Coprinopsis sp. MPI-PUGE-AT-0042]|nr:hypothetical protein BKA70DRAFT_399555 [Coprinopsis sp. MPI-PUGE-AT-0042]
MPLFGSKHKHDKEPAATSGLHTMGPASANHHDHTNTQVLKGDYGVPTAVGSGAGLGLSTNPGLLTGQPAGMAEAPRRDHAHGYAGDGTGLDSATGAHGTHGGMTSHGAQGLDDTHGYRGNIPNTTTGHTSSGGGATGTRMTGKIESAIGSAFNSESMKIKGLEKQREADLINKQGSELAQAEGLEREAVMHRQRAEGLATHGEQSLAYRLDDKFAQRIGGPLDSNNLHHGDRQPY